MPPSIALSALNCIAAAGLASTRRVLACHPVACPDPSRANSLNNCFHSPASACLMLSPMAASTLLAKIPQTNPWLQLLPFYEALIVTVCFHHGISSDTQICLIPFNASVAKTSATRLWFSIALVLFLLIWILVLCLQAAARSCTRLQPQSRCHRDDVAHLLTCCWLISFVARHVAIALRPLLVLSCFAWPLVRPSLPVCVRRRLSAPCPPPVSTSHSHQKPARRFERQLCLLVV